MEDSGGNPVFTKEEQELLRRARNIAVKEATASFIDEQREEIFRRAKELLPGIYETLKSERAKEKLQ